VDSVQTVEGEGSRKGGGEEKRRREEGGGEGEKGRGSESIGLECVSSEGQHKTMTETLTIKGRAIENIPYDVDQFEMT
jgi:hypothetical protein